MIPPQAEAGDASGAVGESGSTPQTHITSPVNSSNVVEQAPFPAPDVPPISDTFSTDNVTGESGGGVIEPPIPNLAMPATPNIDDDKEIEYSLTLKQVPEFLQEANRHVPSMRSLTRYCQAGSNFLKCRKIKTSYGQEWLVNKESVGEYIDHQPILIDPIALPIDLNVDTLANGGASEANAEQSPSKNLQVPAVMPRTDTPAIGDSEPVSEERTLAELLIENARLTERDEAKSELVNELKEDKEFLREEVREGREGRKHRGEVKDIANKMLETMTTMATVQRLSRGEIDNIVDRGKPNSPEPDVV